MVDVVLVLVFVALVMALFVLALVEASLLHVRRSQVVVHARAGDHRSQRLLVLVDDLPRVMNAVLLAVLLGQVTATSIAGILADRWFGRSGVTIATVVVTVLLFIYGEAIPKTLALRAPFGVARRLAAPVQVLTTVFRPLVSVLVKIADWQSPNVSIDTVTAVSEEELRHLADEAAEAGRIEETDAELIERSFDLGDLTVEQIMVPSSRIRAVDGAVSVDEALDVAIAAGHRRLPVHEGGLDQIVGFVRLRDLAEATSDDDDGRAARDVVRPLLVVEPSMKVIDLLRSMQSSGRQLAVVADPSGATLGIATIEDVVRVLVGAIDDPTPRPSRLFRRRRRRVRPDRPPTRSVGSSASGA
jgi:CBS domain containing-hemolysin-like protein